ncbi:hypothetical protein DDI_4446 [Dickeya dianthicola RNS04.9]|nr:hypothetical protein DDI_4446 [Dickeya dianthicola RNS04.9]
MINQAIFELSIINLLPTTDFFDANYITRITSYIVSLY